MLSVPVGTGLTQVYRCLKSPPPAQPPTKPTKSCFQIFWIQSIICDEVNDVCAWWLHGWKGSLGISVLQSVCYSRIPHAQSSLTLVIHPLGTINRNCYDTSSWCAVIHSTGHLTLVPTFVTGARQCVSHHSQSSFTVIATHSHQLWKSVVRSHFDLKTICDAEGVAWSWKEFLQSAGVIPSTVHSYPSFVLIIQ